MKYFIDGDNMCVVRDSFVDLQSSPAVFVPFESDLGQRIWVHGYEGVSTVIRLLIETELSLMERLASVRLLRELWDVKSPEVDLEELARIMDRLLKAVR